MHRRISTGTGAFAMRHVPLAADERSATIFGERELIEEELVDVIQPDTGRAGGITQMKKIAAMAEAHHIQMAPHSGSLGPVAEYAALHVLAAIPNALILERIDDDWDGRLDLSRDRSEQKFPLSLSSCYRGDEGRLYE